MVFKKGSNLGNHNQLKLQVSLQSSLRSRERKGSYMPSSTDLEMEVLISISRKECQKYLRTRQ